MAKELKSVGARVTQEIINNACRNSKNRCMVADAVQAKYPDAKHIWVDTQFIRLSLGSRRYFFATPQNIKNLIATYDDHGPTLVKPFSFYTDFLARKTPTGFWATHKADNRTNPSKKYYSSEKKRKYAPMKRVHGVCVTA